MQMWGMVHCEGEGAFGLRDLGGGRFLMVLLTASACSVSLLNKGGLGLGLQNAKSALN